MEHLQVDITLDYLLKIGLCVLHHDVESVEGGGLRRVYNLDEFD